MRAAVPAELSPRRRQAGNAGLSVEGALDRGMALIGELSVGRAVEPIEWDSEPGGDGSCLGTTCAVRLCQYRIVRKQNGRRGVLLTICSAVVEEDLRKAC